MIQLGSGPNCIILPQLQRRLDDKSVDDRMIQLTILNFNNSADFFPESFDEAPQW